MQSQCPQLVGSQVALGTLVPLSDGVDKPGMGLRVGEPDIVGAGRDRVREHFADGVANQATS